MTILSAWNGLSPRMPMAHTLAPSGLHKRHSHRGPPVTTELTTAPPSTYLHICTHPLHTILPPCRPFLTALIVVFSHTIHLAHYVCYLFSVPCPLTSTQNHCLFNSPIHTKPLDQCPSTAGIQREVGLHQTYNQKEKDSEKQRVSLTSTNAHNLESDQLYCFVCFHIIWIPEAKWKTTQL